MQKKFNWTDLYKLLDSLGEKGKTSRRAFVIRLILSGERVDLSKSFPSIKGRYSPSSVRNQLKKLLRKHDGVIIEGNVVWIPEAK